MAESNDVQAIEKISAVVGESQVKIIISNQCIKAQAFLVNRLKRQFEHQKEVSKFISTDNLKLEAEIKCAEQEIKSLTLAHESIQSANVELKKEWQLAKETTQETAERIQLGEKKYDELWEQCKSRYESIGFVQNWLQATKKKEALEESINVLDKETCGLLDEIKTKQNIISTMNKKRIIELAEYFIHERPKMEENISILSKELNELNNQVGQLMKSRVVQDFHNKHTGDIADASPKSQVLKSSSVKIDDGWPNLNKNLTSNVNTLMPKLQIMNFDLDVMSVKLDQIKKSDLGGDAVCKTSPLKLVNSDQCVGTEPKLGLTYDKGHKEYISSYFHKSANSPNTGDVTEENNSFNYSKRKLINILEDIKLDKNDTYNLVSKVNLENLQGVTVITANVNKNNETPSESTNDTGNDNAQTEDIGELDLTASNVEQVILPPSGFLDQLRCSQEKKKKVSFELPTSVQELSLEMKKDIHRDDDDGENEANVTNSPIDESAGSEESFTKMKDMILKKHKLDLSPQFIYSKNTAIHLQNDEVVKSNYFRLSCEEIQPSISGAQTGTAKVPDDVDDDCDEPIRTNTDNEVTDYNVDMKVDENVITSAKGNREQNIAKPVAGLLFNHGPSGLPDSLDVSISTTGFEEGDADYPQYSSLLLSPKADLPILSTIEKAEVEVISQDVPNFLSGLRKTGLSFFGKMTGTNSNMDDVRTQNEKNNFNFTFGSDDKKNRGGLFNMFN